MQLKEGTLLQNGKYKIERVLGQGGFGITYLAHHKMLDCKVAIKEFFFKSFCNRESNASHVTLGTEANRIIVDRFLQKFRKEAQTIFKLHHPNIIQIYDIFSENGTSYYVMEYVEGESLGRIIRNIGTLKERDAISYITEVGRALTYIHGLNINHLDIKPDNIMLRKSDNKIILIDFGVAKQYDSDTMEGTTSTPVGISHGYSPLEQYRSDGVQEFSPQSDVYSLAATLFKLLTGKTPPEAIEIQEEGLPSDELKAKGVNEQTIHAIEKAMLSRKKRTQTVNEFIESINSANSFEQKSVSDNEETVVINSYSNSSPFNQSKKEDSEENNKEKNSNNFEKTTEHKKNSKNFKSAEELEETVIVTQLLQKSVSKDVAGDIYIKNIPINFVEVKGGSMTMYCRKSKQDYYIRRMTNITSFLMSSTPVTQRLWKAVMGYNPSKIENDSFPVVNVSWHDCIRFIDRINLITGKEFRLPTEAEWEFAARGGALSQGYKFSGSNDLDQVGWYRNNSKKTLHPVKCKLPNELGLFDMSGNVWEWCYDIFNDYEPGVAVNPVCEFNDNTLNVNIFRRVRRGGSWFGYQNCCESNYREACDSNLAFDNLGFRLVL